MLKYIFRRILIFIPTLFIISLLGFIISVNAPGDPVDALFAGAGGEDGSITGSNERVAREKDILRKQLGLDLPIFYFNLSSLAEPDTFHRINDKSERESLQRLLSVYSNWKQISNWRQQLCDLRKSVSSYRSTNQIGIAEDSTTVQTLSLIRDEVMGLLVSSDVAAIQIRLKKIDQLSSSSSLYNTLRPLIQETQTAFREMITKTSRWKKYIPVLHFYGYNQYHRWLFGDGNWLTGKNAKYTHGVIRGDFGTSYGSKQAVMRTVARAVPWSILMTLVSVILAYLISLPIGVYAASRKDSLFDRTSSVLLFMLYSFPSFFMGTLLLLLFANPDVFNWFEANGIKPADGYPADASLFEKIRISFPYFVLPIITYTYSSLAFLSRQMRVSMLEIIHQDYIRTARAKGLSERKVIWKHALRNALLPIITVFSSIFPAAIGGSVILEVLFGIPGMGREIVEAIRTQDYPMIVTVFTLSGFMTLVGYLFADVIYALVDPRISYSKR
jgi:peptide/nickel transport system permease protein